MEAPIIMDTMRQSVLLIKVDLFSEVNELTREIFLVLENERLIVLCPLFGRF